MCKISVTFMTYKPVPVEIPQLVFATNLAGSLLPPPKKKNKNKKKQKKNKQKTTKQQKNKKKNSRTCGKSWPGKQHYKHLKAVAMLLITPTCGGTKPKMKEGTNQ